MCDVAVSLISTCLWAPQKIAAMAVNIYILDEGVVNLVRDIWLEDLHIPYNDLVQLTFWTVLCAFVGAQRDGGGLYQLTTPKVTLNLKLEGTCIHWCIVAS